uniref:Uncharacterized protein n=1 Tax=viral metagenome TaxID=1070528 RepID=A0A6C0LTS4_9ZZZZ
MYDPVGDGKMAFPPSNALHISMSMIADMQFSLIGTCGGSGGGGGVGGGDVGGDGGGNGGDRGPHWTINSATAISASANGVLEFVSTIFSYVLP